VTSDASQANHLLGAILSRTIEKLEEQGVPENTLGRLKEWFAKRRKTRTRS